MLRPLTERQTLERERDEEQPRQLAQFQAELAATASGDTVRREMKEWQIRRVRKRMAEVDRRLATKTR